MKRRLVHLRWSDAYSPGDSGWLRESAVIDDHTRPYICSAAGFLVHETKETLTVASQMTHRAQSFSGIVTVPKRAVVWRRDLGWVEVPQ